VTGRVEFDAALYEGGPGSEILLMKQGRPFLSLRTQELERIYENAVRQKALRPLTLLQYELSFRKKPTARALERKVRASLRGPKSEIFQMGDIPKRDQIIRTTNSVKGWSFYQTLKALRNYCDKGPDNPPTWLATALVRRAIYEFWLSRPTDFFQLNHLERADLRIKDQEKSGILSYFGYRTDVSQNVRRQILILLMEAYIPPVSNWQEWGDKNSIARKRKVIRTLSGLAFPHRHQRSYQNAVRKWDQDCAWFKERFEC